MVKRDEHIRKTFDGKEFMFARDECGIEETCGRGVDTAPTISIASVVEAAVLVNSTVLAAWLVHMIVPITAASGVSDTPCAKPFPVSCTGLKMSITGVFARCVPAAE